MFPFVRFCVLKSSLSVWSAVTSVLRGTSVWLCAFPCLSFIVDMKDLSRFLSVFFLERFLNPFHNVFGVALRLP